MKVETDFHAEGMEESYLLASIACLVQLACLYNPGPTIQDGSIHIILGLPISDVNQENSSQTCSQATLIEAVPSLRSPLPKYV